LRHTFATHMVRKGTNLRVVIHGYFGVDLRVVWETVRDDLPPFRAAIARMLEDFERGQRHT